MSKKKEKNATLVGFFLFFGLVCLGILIAQFGNLGGKLRGDYKIYVTFGDASGLVKDSEVTYGGARVGKVVNQPKLDEDGLINVTLSINGHVKIQEGSTFSINSVSFLGDKSVAIRPPEVSTDNYIQAGATFKGADGSGLDAIQNEAQNIAMNANEAIKDVREMAKKLDASITKFDTMVEETTTAMKSINENVLSEENTKSIKATIANIEKSSENIKETSKELKPLIAKVEPMLKEAKETMATVKKATKTAEKAFDKASTQIDNIKPALAELPDTLKNLKKASAKATGMMDKVGGIADGAKTFLAKINNNQGLLKTITDDKELTADTKTFVKNLKTYGILRYRDDETAEPPTPRTDRFKGGRR